MKLNRYSITRTIVIISFLLMFILISSLIITIDRVEKQYQTLSLNMAKSYFDTIIELRKWNASHNGVYVPVTEKSQPNPYLEDPLRDVETSEGIKLTKINPAYMTRLLSELAQKDLRLQFHMTSLKPINPINAPDNWETESLKTFEENAENQWIIDETEDGKYLRYMEPLIVEESCLQCHAKQGYKVGDVRGAISIKMPYEDFQKTMDLDIFRTVTIYLCFMLIIGVVLIYFGKKSFSTEKELRKFSGVIEQSGNSILLTNGQGLIEYVNPKFESFTGYKKEEVLGKDSLMLYDKENAADFHDELWQTITSGQIWRGEILNKKKNGELYWTNSTIAPIVDDEGRINNFFAINIDITKNKELEGDRKRLINELERSNKELEHFAYVASHDLREPLRKVSAFGQLLKESLKEKMNEDEKENLGFMIDGAQRLQQMIDDLLSYSRVTTQAKPFQIIDLNEVINDLKENFLHAEILVTGALIEVPQPLPKVYGDLTQIRQLLQNLIANGLKYRKKDVKPVTTIRSIAQENNYVKIEIEDNGIGIDEKYFEIIFTMFKRLHGRGQYEGTGLGLAICKKIVERHGGTIGVNSMVDKGSTFWFTIQLPPGNKGS